MDEPAASGVLPLRFPLAQLARGGAAGLIAALDHLLEQNAWARATLAPYGGRRVMVGVDASASPRWPGPRMVAVIGEGGRLSAAAHSDTTAPAVTMLLRPSIDALFDLARGGPRNLSRHLRIEGDVQLAGALGEVARHLRWDAVEDLSRFTGDIAAERIASAAKGGFDALRSAGASVQSGAARYLSVESGRLVDKGALSVLAGQLDLLERRVAALSSRSPPAP
jgi:ubiquinone biosynthesis protein UbiJ